MSMRLSARIHYGLRVLVQLGLETENGGRLPGRAIAEAQDVSGSYVEQILLPMMTAGLVESSLHP